MDPHSFDSLSRRLAASATRRTLVGAAIAAIVGAGVATEASAAGRTCRLYTQKCVKDSQCCSGTCTAATRRSRIRTCACTSLCGSLCADFDTDVNHCGGCDNACPDGAICRDGKCACPDDITEGFCAITRDGEVIIRSHSCWSYGQANISICQEGSECEDLLLPYVYEKACLYELRNQNGVRIGPDLEYPYGCLYFSPDEACATK